MGSSQKHFDTRLVLLLPVFAFFLGFFRFCFFFLGLFLDFFDALLGLLVFLFLLALAQFLAVLLDLRGDFLSVEIEKGEFLFFFFRQFAGFIVFGLLLQAGSGVVLLELVNLLLVRVELFEEFFQVGQLHLRLHRKIEHALADGFVDTHAGDAD